MTTGSESRRSEPFTCSICQAFKGHVMEAADGFHTYRYNPRIYAFDTCSPECARVAYGERITTLLAEREELREALRGARHKLDLIVDRVQDGLLDTREVQRTLDLCDSLGVLLTTPHTEQEGPLS